MSYAESKPPGSSTTSCLHRLGGQESAEQTQQLKPQSKKAAKAVETLVKASLEGNTK